MGIEKKNGLTNQSDVPFLEKEVLKMEWTEDFGSFMSSAHLQSITHRRQLHRAKKGTGSGRQKDHDLIT